jgi:hypothetical protein
VNRLLVALATAMALTSIAGTSAYGQIFELTTASQTRLARDSRKAVKKQQRQFTGLDLTGDLSRDSVLTLIEHQKTSIELLRLSEREATDRELQAAINRMLRARQKELTELEKHLKRLDPQSASVTATPDPFKPFLSPEE